MYVLERHPLLYFVKLTFSLWPGRKKNPLWFYKCNFPNHNGKDWLWKNSQMFCQCDNVDRTPRMRRVWSLIEFRHTTVMKCYYCEFCTLDGNSFNIPWKFLIYPPSFHYIDCYIYFFDIESCLNGIARALHVSKTLLHSQYFLYRNHPGILRGARK